MAEWWTECGKCDPKKRKTYKVKIPDRIKNRKEIEAYFIRKHDVHLWPSRCRYHYEGEPDGEG